jgi:Tyrosine phosphatase family
MELLLTGFLLIFTFSPSHCLDSILVACLRKVQEWSFVSILGELRMHSGCRQFDVEQFIEYFDPDIIDISKNTPDFLKIHIRLKVIR